MEDPHERKLKTPPFRFQWKTKQMEMALPQTTIQVAVVTALKVKNFVALAHHLYWETIEAWTNFSWTSIQKKMEIQVASASMKDLKTAALLFHQGHMKSQSGISQMTIQHIVHFTPREGPSSLTPNLHC
ncbi:uncharacterized protein LOC135378587 isoform X3 [Ornithodoros turicata]|uniref:uncharacterized protein LOC135378587 isoform X3 n=1 Tax=Ornithodoros turicata TaxID=34597 RepID=UPI003138DDB9